MQFQYIKDSDVSDELDLKLRGLLSRCFTNGNDAEIFKSRRYYNDAPQHRYLMWDGDNLAAHIAVHEKKVVVNDERRTICGIAEVCVDPDYRKQGLVKQLLDKVHSDRFQQGDDYSVLFGDREVYGSSGYECVNNLMALNPLKKWVSIDKVMVLPLNTQWTEQEVRLVGIPF